MLRVKKLDIFIVKSFFLLFAGTFFICLFIFMMQFLWRYVDELVGKGLEMTVMAQFFFYSGLTLVPISMPLAVLLASLITFGNFGERYELLAMKAAGISLLKIMRPLIVCMVGLCCVSFYFQNVIGPIAQSKLSALIISMKQKSPELDIPEGVFYSEIPNYNLKIAKKDRKTGMMYDVLIYNMKDGFDNAHIIYADSGKLETSADKQHLWLHLYHGDLFENLRSQSAKSQNVPYRRETFNEKHTIIEFNSDFEMVDNDFTSKQAMSKDMRQLQHSIDSMYLVGDSIGRQYYTEISTANYQLKQQLSHEDTVRIEQARQTSINIDSLYQMASLMQKQRVIADAARSAEDLTNNLSFKTYPMDNNDYQIRRHKIEWHKKITLSLSCLLFFFIGAPLGGIIRKGGLGMPVIVSVLLFIIYYIIDSGAYKMARDGRWIVWMGTWTSSAVLAPLGFFLTYKSNKDSVVLNADAYINWFKKVAGIRSVRHLFLKEVIIHDPDYQRLPGDISRLSSECQAYIARNRLHKAPNYFKLWMAGERDDEVLAINQQMEQLIEEMSNTRSSTLLNTLNYYPILSVSAHVRPFHVHWLNLLAGILFPIGLFFYFRIWIFRIRLGKDLERIIHTNEQVQYIIQNLNK